VRSTYVDEHKKSYPGVELTLELRTRLELIAESEETTLKKSIGKTIAKQKGLSRNISNLTNYIPTCYYVGCAFIVAFIILKPNKIVSNKIVSNKIVSNIIVSNIIVSNIIVPNMIVSTL
jgi:hypothetical protein